MIPIKHPLGFALWDAPFLPSEFQGCSRGHTYGATVNPRSEAWAAQPR